MSLKYVIKISNKSQGKSLEVAEAFNCRDLTFSESRMDAKSRK